MDTEKEKLQKTLQQQTQEIGINPAFDNIKNIPTIRTFEGDILDSVNNNKISQISTISRQLDSESFNSDVYKTAEKLENRKKFLIISSLVLSIIFVSALSFFYYKNYYNKKPVQDVIQTKTYFISDIWAQAPITVTENTDVATSTDSSIIVKVKNFDNLYYFMLNNESVLSGIASQKFSYSKLEKFSDISIENQDLRIADGESGALVYGFIGKDYLLISNSLSGWLSTSKTLK